MRKTRESVLSIELAPSIQKSVDGYFDSENFEKNCDKCGSTQECERNDKIGKTCGNLIIHMKRFNNKMEKNSAPVDITEILKYKNIDYRLRGFIVHSGSFNGGHYIYIGKDGEGRWIKYDDSHCSYIRNMNLATYKTLAYIVLYEIVKINKI